ncbi:unnamed protein product [Rhodiola kirilowii]
MENECVKDGATIHQAQVGGYRTGGPWSNAQQPKLFVGMILILIFAEALALYGLIVGIILSSRAGQSIAD